MRTVRESAPAMAVSRSGFTLVELLAVMAIIAIIAGAVIGFSRLGGVKATQAMATSQMEKLRNQLDDYREKHNTYPLPVSTTYINMAVEPEFKDWQEQPYNLNLTDPWGTPYQYQHGDTYEYKLWSWGPDKRKDTADDLR